MIHAKEIASAARQKEQEYLAGWQRARAELDNYRKRIQHEQAESARKKLIQIIEPLLQLKDNFNALTVHLPEDLKNNTWAQGVLHVNRQLDDILSQYNVQIIGKAGEDFDPAKHEAIARVKKKGVSEGKITEVIRPGYILAEQTIRPAQVKVSS